MKIFDYEIGGIHCRMTAAQAARWNDGTWTDEDESEIMVVFPDEYGFSSRLVDGEPIIHRTHVVEFSHSVCLRDAWGKVEGRMEGMPANLIATLNNDRLLRNDSP